MQVVYTTFTVKERNSEQEASALYFVNAIKQQKDKKSFEVKTREPDKLSAYYQKGKPI